MDVISYSKAKKAQEKANSVEAQLNQAVQSGNQLAETQQARVDDEGVAHSTLQARLNSDANKRKALTGRVADVEEELSLQDRQTQILKHGLNVINGEVGSPLDVEMYGNTLVPLGNSVLQEGKRYVLADRKYKVKFTDGLTYTGVEKFIGQSERPSIIRVANFEGKVSGSLGENPHEFKYRTSSASTIPPNQFTQEHTSNGISSSVKLDGSVTPAIASGAENIAQQLFSFNIIEEIERKVGKIPKETLTEKVQWCKDNISTLTYKWYGYGSSAGGNKASLSVWESSNSRWINQSTPNTSGSVSLIGSTTTGSITLRLSNDGFMHYLAYAEPSDGTTPSVINTDYVELEIELKPNADIHNPKVPLYEVTQDEYNKILTDWDVNEVINRYPSVEGVQHVGNPVISVSGGNLLNPYAQALSVPLTESNPYKARVSWESGFTIVLHNDEYINVIKNTDYTFSMSKQVFSGDLNIVVRDKGNNVLLVSPTNAPVTFNTMGNDEIRVTLIRSNTSSGEVEFSNWMLSLGSTSKPFTPKNDSHLYAETSLAGIGNNRDTLFKQDGVWYKRKVWEINKTSNAYDLSFATNGFNLRRIYSLGSGNLNFILVDGEGRKIGYTGGNSSTTINDVGQFYVTTSGELWISVADDSELKFPYHLTYQLATPIVEPVTVEGDLSIQGMAQVEVGEGVVVREVAKPVFSSSSNRYFINHSALPSSFLKNRVDRVIEIYRNGKKDLNRWRISSATSNGKEHCYIEASDFDLTAQYTVTYTVLDKHLLTAPLTDVKASYNQSLKSSFNSVVAKQSDIATDVSINNRSIVDLYIRLRALEG